MLSFRKREENGPARPYRTPALTIIAVSSPRALCMYSHRLAAETMSSGCMHQYHAVKFGGEAGVGSRFNPPAFWQIFVFFRRIYTT